MRRLLLLGIAAYRRRPERFRRGCCPYTPTCSAYGYQAIERHGARVGLALTLDRLSRCAPGRFTDLIDPVPSKGPIQ